MPRVTASAFASLWPCNAWVAMPWQDKPRVEHLGLGSATHALLEDGATDGFAATEALLAQGLDADAGQVERVSAQAEAGIEWLANICTIYDVREVRREVPLAWSPEGGSRELRSKRHRDYERAEPHELVGTVDVLGVGDVGGDPSGLDPIGLVVDWKTGGGWYLMPLSRDPQLLFAAVALADLHGVDRVVMARPVIDDDGVHTSTLVELDAIGLAEARMLLQDVRERRDHPGEPVPGVHCGGCRAKAACPRALREAVDAAPALYSEGLSKLDAAPEVMADPRSIGFEWSGRPGSAAHAAWMKRHLPVLEAGLEQVKAGLLAWAREVEPIPLGNGKVWGMRQATSREVNLGKPGAFAMLVAELGAEKADAICSRKVSLSALESAVKTKAPRGQKTKAVEDFFARLEAAGVVRTYDYERPTVYTPKDSTQAANAQPEVRATEVE
jgi:PD-(D/E)XK nuclease superfamily